MEEPVDFDYDPDDEEDEFERHHEEYADEAEVVLFGDDLAREQEVQQQGGQGQEFGDHGFGYNNDNEDNNNDDDV